MPPRAIHPGGALWPGVRFAYGWPPGAEMESGAGAPDGATAGAAGGLSILVVDDDRDAADTLAELLREVGHRAEAAYDGVGALAAAGRLRPDVVVLDLGLPRLDGYEVARRLRESRPDARLVALSGSGQPSDRARTRAAGFDEHVVKPAGLDDILAAFGTGPGREGAG